MKPGTIVKGSIPSLLGPTRFSRAIVIEDVTPNGSTVKIIKSDAFETGMNFWAIDKDLQKIIDNESDQSFRKEIVYTGYAYYKYEEMAEFYRKLNEWREQAIEGVDPLEQQEVLYYKTFDWICDNIIDEKYRNGVEEDWPTPVRACLLSDDK